MFLYNTPCTNLSVKDDRVTSSSMHRGSSFLARSLYSVICPSKLMLNSWRSHLCHHLSRCVCVCACLLCLRKWQTLRWSLTTRISSVDSWTCMCKKKKKRCWWKISERTVVQYQWSLVICINGSLLVYLTNKKLPAWVLFRRQQKMLFASSHAGVYAHTHCQWVLLSSMFVLGWVTHRVVSCRHGTESLVP